MAIDKHKWYYKLYQKMKNKYIFAFTIFSIYTLFIDDNNIITIFNHHKKRIKLEVALVEKQEKLDNTKMILDNLNDPKYIEKYARENKYFKKMDEDIFVITYK